MEEHRPKTLIIVRHAESVWNKIAPKTRGKVKEAPPEMKGIPDHATPLTKGGREQAQKTGRALALQFDEFDAIYYSPWVRAAKTAEIIINQFSAKAEKNMRQRMFRKLSLIEQRFGDLDIGTGDPKDIHDKYKAFDKKRRKFGNFWLRPPNGEDWADVCMRTEIFLHMLYLQHQKGERLLFVTHGITAQSLRYNLEQITEEQLFEDYKKGHVHNCGVSRYDWSMEENRYVVRYWNKIYY